MKPVVFQALADAAARNEPVVLAVISRVKGSSPQKAGAKALFHADGRIDGTLGGGCLEAEIQQRALQSLRSGAPEQFELILDHDFGWDDGLICGGKVSGLILPHAQKSGASFWQRLADRPSTLIWGVTPDFAIALNDTSPAGWLHHETVAPPQHLWIAGAGHIAQAVAPLAVQLDFAVTVFDDRPALANPHYFPAPIHLQVHDWDKLLALPFPPQPTFGLVVTRGHRHDALVLAKWIQQPFAFIGMIGSARKSRIIFEHFRDERIATPEQLARVVCPVGLPIESESVPEIAVSIVAQLIQRRAQTSRPS